VQNGKFVPIPFAQMLDPKTGRTRVRRVDPASDRFNIAREYMIRLRKSDFANAETVAKLAAAVKLSPDEFKKQFAGAVAHE
jgi:6-phosphofructokinase 1